MCAENDHLYLHDNANDDARTSRSNNIEKSDIISNEQEHERFLSYFRESKIPHPNEWPDNSPVFVSSSQRAPDITYQLALQQENETNTTVSPFPLDGSVVHFKGPFFHGKIVSRMRDVPSMVTENENHLPPSCSSETYFKGRSRKFQWTVQGIFTKRCRFDKVITGQTLDRPFRNAPSSNMVKRGIDLLRNRLPDSFECDLFANEPRFEHPLICGCQTFRVDTRSSYDQIGHDKVLGEGERGEIIEDCSLLGCDGDDNCLPSRSPEKRRKYFCKKENLEKYYFEPHDYVYTFDFYANFFSPARHRIEITPFFSYDLIPYFNGQPLFMAMAKDKESGAFLWGTEVWHSRLIEYDSKEALLKRLFSSSCNSNGSKNPNRKEKSSNKHFIRRGKTVKPK